MREKTAAFVVRVEAQSLAEEIGSYNFCICIAIWYEVLRKIQHVSKPMCCLPERSVGQQLLSITCTVVGK